MLTKECHGNILSMSFPDRNSGKRRNNKNLFLAN